MIADSYEHLTAAAGQSPDSPGSNPEEGSARIADRNMRKPGLFDPGALRSMESNVGEKAARRG
jgi:hypothetical protein